MPLVLWISFYEMVYDWRTEVAQAGSDCPNDRNERIVRERGMVGVIILKDPKG